MMLTDEYIDVLFLKHAGTNDYGYPYLRCYADKFRHIARDVIAANTAKVLEKLEPAYQLQTVELAYSVDQVATLIQDRDALAARVKELEAWLEGEATCPCCGQSVTCLDGCTFADDAPHGHDKMQETRNLLKAAP